MYNQSPAERAVSRRSQIGSCHPYDYVITFVSGAYSLKCKGVSDEQKNHTEKLFPKNEQTTYTMWNKGFIFCSRCYIEYNRATVPPYT